MPFLRNVTGPMVLVAIPILVAILVTAPLRSSAQPAASTARPATDAAAQPAAQTVSTFVTATRLGYISCAEKYRAYLERWEFYALMTEGQREPQGTPPTDNEVADCVHQTGVKGAALYKAALKSVSSPKERSAYSEYMTAWDSALKSIRKSQRETVKAYRARQRQTEERLDQLQSRLEASVNLQG